MEIARNILDDFSDEYGSECNYLKKVGGDILSQEETEKIFTEYIKSSGLEQYINILFLKNTVSPTSIVHDPNGKSTVIIGLPTEYHRNFIQGVMDHEIGTHYLRKANDAMQSWGGKGKKQAGLLPYIATEEGLASVNQLVNDV